MRPRVMAVVVVVVALADATGCGYPALPRLDETGDGGVGTDADGSGSMFTPLHVETVLQGAPDVVLSSNPTLVDTTALTINGATNAFFVRQGDYAVLFASAFSVQNPVKVTGTLPLIVVAKDAVMIFASIDLGAVGRTPGPGALGPNPGTGKPGSTFLPAGDRMSSGGGGGSYGTLGGPGGTSSASMIPAGASGVRYGINPGVPLAGGSSGGAGGFASGAIGAGGAGGGALQISSASSITLLTSGTIRATGGGGATGGAGFVGGGGGGSGGEILLEAPTLTIAGRMFAGGGGGGGGGAAGSMVGADGQDGIAGPTAARGGSGGIPQGSNGGDGAAVVSGVLVEAEAGEGFNSKGGGGGGGAGRIWLRHRAATPPVLTGSTISPVPGTDPTLP